MATELVVTNEGAELEVLSPQQMAATLAYMKEKLSLVQRFFKEVMVPNQDYGTIPGTDKPSLLKSGAEKLCELYGFAPKVASVEEQSNIDTGFYRARVTVALIHRRASVVVAEGVGEANTLESRYRWRWIAEWDLPKGLDTSVLQVREKKTKNGRPYKVYRVENDDPWSLWNTVLKMAKKRALVDATLSATRSSGIFTQDAEDLRDWIAGGGPIDEKEGEGDVEPAPESGRTQAPPSPRTDAQTKAKAVFAHIREWALGRGVDPKAAEDAARQILHESYKVDTCGKLTAAQWQQIWDNRARLVMRVEAALATPDEIPAVREQAEAEAAKAGSVMAEQAALI